MTRFSVCILALIPLCCASVAQLPVSNAVSNPGSTPVSAPVSVQSAATSVASPEIREFQKIEDSWSMAVNDRDQYGLELVLSPLFVDVSASGDITTRNQQVATVITGEDKTVHLDQRVITVRMLGDVAVTNGTYALHHKANTAEVTEKASSRMYTSAPTEAGCASIRSAPCSTRTRTRSRKSNPTPSCPSTSRCFRRTTRDRNRACLRRVSARRQR
jgi:hypothetical protein